MLCNEKHSNCYEKQKLHSETISTFIRLGNNWKYVGCRCDLCRKNFCIGQIKKLRSFSKLYHNSDRTQAWCCLQLWTPTPFPCSTWASSLTGPGSPTPLTADRSSLYPHAQLKLGWLPLYPPAHYHSLLRGRHCILYFHSEPRNSQDRLVAQHRTLLRGRHPILTHSQQK